MDEPTISNIARGMIFLVVVFVKNQITQNSHFIYNN